MAVAWCINAYDCSWNLIRTLEQLQSSNIGVWVQYTAPNPLDDKKINYIKYTDKCGCTCTLSWENEILIYSTNWVIKNLSLTNDDTNERVIVKWNDIFGSNWLKTVVRYKTGSAPTSLTDWTLAVEETTKNQYATNGYWVSWLSDDTTYYFSVFGVDTDGTVINVQSKAITTSFFLAKYQRVEYITSSWWQYIDTWYKWNQNTEFEVKVRMTSTNSANQMRPWWDMWTNTSNSISVVFRNGSNYDSVNNRFWWTVAQLYTSDTPLNTDFTVITNKNWFYLNWTSKSRSWSVWTFTTENNMWLLQVKNKNWTEWFIWRMYYAKITENWTLKRNLVPVYRKSDSVIWMLDITNKVFYTNNWTWTFWKWNNVPR